MSYRPKQHTELLSLFSSNIDQLIWTSFTCIRKFATKPPDNPIAPQVKAGDLQLYQQKALWLWWADHTAYRAYREPEFDFRKKRFFRVTAVLYTLWWRCYIKRYNQRVQYGNLAHVHGDGNKQKLCVHNCGQIAADRDIVMHMVTIDSL